MDLGGRISRRVPGNWEDKREPQEVRQGVWRYNKYVRVERVLYGVVNGRLDTDALK